MRPYSLLAMCALASLAHGYAEGPRRRALQGTVELLEPELRRRSEPDSDSPKKLCDTDDGGSP